MRWTAILLALTLAAPATARAVTILLVPDGSTTIAIGETLMVDVFMVLDPSDQAVGISEAILHLEAGAGLVDVVPSPAGSPFPFGAVYALPCPSAGICGVIVFAWVGLTVIVTDPMAKLGSLSITGVVEGSYDLVARRVRLNPQEPFFFPLFTVIGDEETNRFDFASDETITITVVFDPATGCGNNVREGNEQCDGTDDRNCRGLCQTDCTCPDTVCGNGVQEVGFDNSVREECDGSDDLSCPGQCLLDCICGGLKRFNCECRDGTKLVVDLCDTSCQNVSAVCQDAASVKGCLNGGGSCSVRPIGPCPEICGDGVREGSEECDEGGANGTGSSCCLATCLFRGQGETCRAASGSCDLAETCTGTSGSCPDNAFKPIGSSCPDEGNACTDDECNGAGACIHINNTAPCSDQFFCTVGDVCQGGSCQSGSPRDCASLGNQCNNGTCNESMNECQAIPKPNESICTGGTCQNGVCTPTSCVGDYNSGDVAVVFVDEPTHELLRIGRFEDALPRVVNRFYCSHEDVFQFITLFSSFRQEGDLPDANGNISRAFYQPVMNEVFGIGPVGSPATTDFDPDNEEDWKFDSSSFFGSDRVLEGIINMKSIRQWPKRPGSSDPRGAGEFSTLDVLGQEIGHRWGAFARFSSGSELHSTDLLGRAHAHWNFFLDSNASVMEGNKWRSRRRFGDFISRAVTKGYSPLDLYLMGFYGKEQVRDFFYIDPADGYIDPHGDAAQCVAEACRVAKPLRDATTIGTRIYVSIDDVIASLGARVPSVLESRRIFRQVFVLLVQDGQLVERDDIVKVNRVRKKWAKWFNKRTKRRAGIDTTLN